MAHGNPFAHLTRAELALIAAAAAVIGTACVLGYAGHLAARGVRRAVLGAVR